MDSLAGKTTAVERDGLVPESDVDYLSSQACVESVGVITSDAHAVFVRRESGSDPPISVRRIPISTRSITGQLRGQGFESALERDLLMQLAWDDEVLWFATQPIKIHYEFPLKRPRHYTPDVLIMFDPKSGCGRSPMLCEVKYRAEIAKNWRELRRKFRAAKAECSNLGWRFVVLTEDHIRTPRLKNIQFLWPYRNAPFNADVGPPLLDCVLSHGAVTMARAVETACATRNGVERADAIWAWWVLVANRKIVFDIDEPIRIDTLFRLPRIPHEGD